MASNESDYLEGRRSVWRRLLSEAILALGYDEKADAAKWIVEREDTVVKLREVCDEFGDNDSPNDLHLGDVIEKHLIPHLRRGKDG